MKRLVIILIALVGFSLPTRPSDTDSLVVEDLQYLKKRINLLVYQLHQIENNQAGSLDSLQTLSSHSLKKIDELQTQASQHHQSLQDSLHSHSGKLYTLMSQAHKRLHQGATLQIILLIAGLALIVVFFVLYIRERRRSIDRLIKTTRQIAEQNEHILEKTSELEKIRSELEKNLKQQKKIKKRVKKIKK